MLHGTAGGEIQLRTGLARRIAAVLILRACEAIALFGFQEVRLMTPSCCHLGGRHWEARTVCYAAAFMRRWPCRMLLVRANSLSTLVTLRRPRTTNWRRLHCRKRALMHSPMVRRL